MCVIVRGRFVHTDALQRQTVLCFPSSSFEMFRMVTKLKLKLTGKEQEKKRWKVRLPPKSTDVDLSPAGYQRASRTQHVLGAVRWDISCSYVHGCLVDWVFLLSSTGWSYSWMTLFFPQFSFLVFFSFPLFLFFLFSNSAFIHTTFLSAFLFRRRMF